MQCTCIIYISSSQLVHRFSMPATCRYTAKVCLFFLAVKGQGQLFVCCIIIIFYTIAYSSVSHECTLYYNIIYLCVYKWTTRGDPPQKSHQATVNTLTCHFDYNDFLVLNFFFFHSFDTFIHIVSLDFIYLFFFTSIYL